MLNKVQTVQAGGDGVGGGKGVLEDGGGEEAAAGRQDHQRARTGMGKTWVNAAQNKSEGPEGRKEQKESEQLK